MAGGGEEWSATLQWWVGGGWQVTVIATNFLGEASQAAVHTISALWPLPILLQIQVPLPPFHTTQVSTHLSFCY